MEQHTMIVSNISNVPPSHMVEMRTFLSLLRIHPLSGLTQYCPSCDQDGSLAPAGLALPND